MQLPTTMDDLMINNIGSVNEFKIRASAKSFAILSNSLYQNKIRAIIRELSCNALDSHRAANNPQRFQVTLPTILDPQFSVRDFGTGLSHNQVMSLYTTYFESTKTSSNDFIGALGLGSKSPFSYTNAFTVTSYQDGWCGSYAAFIDERGIPNIAQMNEDSTDQPNGVEIQFAVKSDDISRFYNEAQYVYQWWSSADVPLIPSHGSIKFQSFNDIAALTDIDGVFFFPDGDGDGSYARMGNIAYPIDDSILEDKLRAVLHRQRLVIDFAIGELDFQPSREGLSYIDFTRNALVQRVQSIYDTLYTNALEQINGVDGVWEKHQVVTELCNESATSRIYRPICNDLIRNHPIPQMRPSDRWAVPPSQLPIMLLTINTELNIQVTSGLRSDVDHNGMINLLPVSNYLYRFIISNTPKVSGLIRRMKLTFPANDGYRVFCLSPIDPSKPMDTDRWFTEVAMGVPSDMIVSNVDELARPPAGTRKPSTGQPKTIGTHTVDVLTIDGIGRKTINLDDTSKIKYYVTAKDRQWIPKHPNMLGHSYSILYHLGKFVREYANKQASDVYMLSERRVAKISSNQTWRSFEQLVVDVIEQVKAEVDRMWVRDQCHYRNDKWLRLINSVVKHPKCDEDTEYHWSSLKKVCNSTNPMLNQLALIDNDLCDKIINRIQHQERLINEFATKYPILQHVDDFSNPMVVQEVLNYINLVNSQQTNE